TIELSTARVIVALGTQVRGWLSKRWHLQPRPVSEIELNGVTRVIAFLPHPASFGQKTFESVMPDELARLRAVLAGCDQVREAN
ncbi:MAG: hypothetical protein O7C01_06745, partial [Actinobacteria bacterium]|nr:hypothetical protein [Actinomycetota bacterium]